MKFDKHLRKNLQFTYSFGVILSLGSAAWCYLGSGYDYTRHQIYAVTVIIGMYFIINYIYLTFKPCVLTI